MDFAYVAYWGCPEEDVIANRRHCYDVMDDIKKMGYSVSNDDNDGLTYEEAINRVSSLNGKRDDLRWLCEEIRLMGVSDAVYFSKGWENDPTACLLHEIAKYHKMHIEFEE